MIDALHTILMVLQIHISFVRIANHFHGNSKLVPNGQLDP